MGGRRKEVVVKSKEEGAMKTSTLSAGGWRGGGTFQHPDHLCGEHSSSLSSCQDRSLQASGLTQSLCVYNDHVDNISVRCTSTQRLRPNPADTRICSHVDQIPLDAHAWEESCDQEQRSHVDHVPLCTVHML